jgi:hypothetical protein
MLNQVQHDDEGTPFASFFPSRPSREPGCHKVHAEARRHRLRSGLDPEELLVVLRA